jgi:hypothetical protein
VPGHKIFLSDYEAERLERDWLNGWRQLCTPFEQKSSVTLLLYPEYPLCVPLGIMVGFGSFRIAGRALLQGIH